MSRLTTLIQQSMHLSIALMNWPSRFINRLLAAKDQSGFFFGVRGIVGSRNCCVGPVACVPLTVERIG
jgi:hypothetical protein